MGALSNDYTAKALWREAVRDLAPGDNIPKFEQFNLMNRACQTIPSLCYDLMSRWYEDYLPIVTPASGKVSSASGTWVASTGLLTITMSTSFASTDVGNLIVFSLSGTVYAGVISGYTSATAVTVTGGNLPSSNISPTQATMLGANPTSDTITLAGIRIMRAGQQVAMRLESTATDYVSAISPDELRVWRPSEDGNYKKIVWSLVGTNLFRNKGDGLSDYGTSFFYYPRVPYLLATLSQKVDVPDGLPMQLTIMYLSRLIAQRRRVPAPDNMQQIGTLLQMMYSTNNMQIDAEALTQKAQALK